jgi:hypothetical protein
MWFEKLSSFLLNLRYKQSKNDRSLFIKKRSVLITVILVYVDDLIIGGNNLTEIIALKRVLDAKFKIKDLGELKYFLGLEIARSKKGIFLNQRKYALDLIDSSGLLAGKPVQSPMVKDCMKSSEQTDYYSDPERYRRLIGRMLYLTTTRPDITYVVQQLSQQMHKPREGHYNAALRIIHYLKGNPGQGLLYPNNSELKLKAYSYADWATCAKTRRSTTGYCVFLGNSLISWRCKKQSTISRSSFEAEYIALANTVCELQWLTYLLRDFKIKFVSLPYYFVTTTLPDISLKIGLS